MVQSFPSKISEITFGDGFLSVADSISDLDVRDKFISEANGYAKIKHSGNALRIDDFDGPYNLELGYNAKERALALTFTLSADPCFLKSFELPFREFQRKIREDRQDLIERFGTYKGLDREAVIAKEDKYTGIHGLNAVALLYAFEGIDIESTNIDFFKDFYELLRFAAPTGKTLDQKYANFYASLHAC